MFTSTFAGLTICCSCWFSCCKPAYQPYYGPPAYPGTYSGRGVVYPQPYYGPGVVQTKPYPPGTVIVPPSGGVIEKKAMPAVPTVPGKLPTVPVVPSKTPAVKSSVPPTVEVKPATPKAEPRPKEKTLYDRLGGETAIKAVVDELVARAAADPKVNFTRKGTAKEWKATPENVAHVKEMLVELVGMVTGGPQKYTGRSMKESHAGMKITQVEFDALAGHLKAALDKFKVPAKEQNELLKIVGSTASDIVEVKGK